MPRPKLFTRLAGVARLPTYLLALWKLFKHPQTPLPAKIVAILVVAYAVSPIDLIPDFIPVLGMLDDLVIVPLGVALVVKLTPAAHWQARLREAELGADKLPRLLWGAALVLLLWLALLGLIAAWMLGGLGS